MAYVDSFFSYLSSQIYHNDNFPNGLDCYGSFICNKKNFKIDVYDDIEYLMEKTFFLKTKKSSI